MTTNIHYINLPKIVQIGWRHHVNFCVWKNRPLHFWRRVYVYYYFLTLSTRVKLLWIDEKCFYSYILRIAQVLISSLYIYFCCVCCLCTLGQYISLSWCFCWRNWFKSRLLYFSLPDRHDIFALCKVYSVYQAGDWGQKLYLQIN